MSIDDQGSEHVGRTAVADRPDTAMSPRGLRFVDPAEELRYRSWYVQEALSPTRSSFAASIALWTMVLVLSALFEDGLVKSWPWCAGVVCFFVGVLALSHVDAGRRWILQIAAVSNVAAGLALIGLGEAVLPDRYDLTVLAGGVVAVVYFGFVVLRLHPTAAALSTAVTSTTYLALIWAQFADDAIESPGFWLTVVVVTVAYCGGLFICVATEHRMRLRYADARIIEWQAIVIDRQRAEADALLSNMLPEPIVERLKRDPGVIADRYDAVSMLFADMVGFTPLSDRLGASDMVELLNRVFTAFDVVVDDAKVEKIRTIGDGYMVASGLPTERDDHAEVLVDVAQRMLAFVETDEVCRAHGVQLRIGVNSGPVVAGVIGRRTLQYDVWGDTVNTAARMESHGVAGRVQITAATHELVRHRFECEHRGTIDVKGKGPLETWLVVGDRAD